MEGDSTDACSHTDIGETSDGLVDLSVGDDITDASNHKDIGKTLIDLVDLSVAC